MLAVSHPISSALPSPHDRVMDESGTINPAALNSSASTITPNLLSQPAPRGTKRSRSPDSAVAAGPETDDFKSVKRSRPHSSGGMTRNVSTTMAQQPVHTPQISAQSLPQSSPTQGSPQRSTPGSATKPSVVKALPTVRDHTTDQLNPEGDEYIPRETDPDGETKVSKDGYPLDGRKFRCRTFQVPNRGEKLFMLATECARVLGYRDSYLLFNKNRSLYKIIANQHEKDNLIYQEILPFSYRSRQIAIVTARSMFRQFGSRLIESGRRVRDDYWEAKARKQGFTEEDLAGEKRPGAAKAREAAAAQASQHAIHAFPPGQIIYSDGIGGMDGQPPGLVPESHAPLPMIHLPSEELRTTYGQVLRPRQEPAGPPYQDRTQSSNPSDVYKQAHEAAEYNKQLATTRAHRANYLDDYWRRPHEQPVTQAEQGAQDASTVVPQHLQSPHAAASRGPQDQMGQHGSQMMPNAYAGFPHPQNPMASPVQAMNRPMPPGQLPQASPAVNIGSAHRATPSYGYSANPNMWQGPPTQPSPLPHGNAMQYGQQQHQSPMPPPQLPHQPSAMGYGQMNQMTTPNMAMNRSMYQPSPTPQQFNMGAMSTAAPQPGMQPWSGPGGAGGMPQDWQRYQ
ncbi:hypothetical protein D0861_00350 [Hortaea werneckii]|uniref:Uncharacterized protein n=1 Tax=Hortaea werneckii TaxID=91943 RepID=A0A3M7G4M6_HORWE|nr:hypothetical protein D0861_00350 [Hortaea werneckii]